VARGGKGGGGGKGWQVASHINLTEVGTTVFAITFDISARACYDDDSPIGTATDGNLKTYVAYATDWNYPIMSNIISGAWTVLTTDIETHIGLQFGATITEAIALDSGNSVYRNIALRDIAKGEDVDTRDAFTRYYEVDGEKLVQIAKYSQEKNKLQCYNGKNGLLSDTTVYYNGKGNMYVKESQRTIKQQSDRGEYVKTDIFAGKKKA